MADQTNSNLTIEAAEMATADAVPHASQPGSLLEQMQTVGLYLANPWQYDDRDRRWRASRRTIMPHARAV